MYKKESFVTLNSNLVFEKVDLNRRNSIIKGSNAKINGSRIISTDFEEPCESHNLIESVEPIIMDDNIVGVKYKCPCGKHTEIMFDFV